MPTRTALVPILALAAVLVAACGSSSPVPATPGPSAPATPPPAPTVSPDTGNVVGEYPQLSVEVRAGGAIDVAIEDPDAKAWRLTVSGVGDRAADRLELVIETGDVTAVAELREVRKGVVVDTLDLTGMIGDPTVAAGGCHATLPVCVGSDGIAYGADGVLRVRLDVPEPAALTIRGATAGWPGEPFMLGPWEETPAFAWPQG